MTQVFYSSTLFGSLTLAAAIDSGQFGPHEQRRVLITSTNTAIPELNVALHALTAFESLAKRFDDIVYWNDLIAPQHPAQWSPRAEDVPLMSRLVVEHLGLGGPAAELVLESVAVAPARTLATVIRDCPITVYSDGLMSYGPTRSPLPGDISGRIERVLHLDLVPELTPLLLREYGVRYEHIPTDAFRRILAGIDAGTPTPDPAPIPPGTRSAVVIGQYLSALDIISPDEETSLYADMVRAVAARGITHVTFKPHPAVGRSQVDRLEAVALTRGMRFELADGAVPVEVLLERLRPELAVSCFSTALFTAPLLGVDTASMGCAMILDRLSPYQNSNRIPATIVAALIPELHADGSLHTPRYGPVQELVQAVGYCMQAKHNPDLRSAAEDYLARFGSKPFFKLRRLEALGLAQPPLRRNRELIRVARGVRRRAKLAKHRARPR